MLRAFECPASSLRNFVTVSFAESCHLILAPARLRVPLRLSLDRDESYFLRKAWKFSSVFRQSKMSFEHSSFNEVAVVASLHFSERVNNSTSSREHSNDLISLIRPLYSADEPLESSSALTIEWARRQTVMMSPTEPKVTDDIARCYSDSQIDTKVSRSSSRQMEIDTR